jgi:tetratricopeptide (TPR) repeat protein
MTTGGGVPGQPAAGTASAPAAASNTRARANAGKLEPALQQAVVLLKSGQPQQAEQQIHAILAAAPHEPNALFLLAKARQLQGASAEALALLDGLLARGRDWPSVHQEKGLILRQCGDLRGSVAALRRLVALDPSRAAAWGLIAEMLTSLGEQSAADEAMREYLKAAARPEVLVKVAELVAQGKLAEAEPRCRDYLRHSPDDVDAVRLLAEIATRLGVFDDAEQLFARCIALAPQFHLARAGYAHVLMRQSRFDQSLAEIDKLLAVDPDNTSYRILLASVLVRVGRHREAIDNYQRVVARPGHTALDLASLGHALKTVGRTSEAIDAYHRAIALDPLFGDAYWSLANLKTFDFNDQEVDAMIEAAASDRCLPREYPALCFALGKAYEDRGQYAQAFAQYQRGNARRRTEIRYSADENRAVSEDLMRACTAELFQRHAADGCPDPAPIFIVGLPRSGSTLVEQVLASHSQVDGTGELPEIIEIARRLSGRRRPADASRYPDILQQLDAGQLRELGQEYIERTRIQRRDAPYFIDKMPNNFPHIGLIHLILPNARIIDTRRHPMASCFSAYKQLFATGQNFSYDLGDLGRYYADYVALMAHWDRVLPGVVLRVFYEETVRDTEAAVRRLLDYCGLPFEERCLRFYETERAVRTASSEQVRKPIYHAAVEHWRHFEPQLQQLRTALGSALTEYPF